jgi:hypothetical protein
MVMAVIGGCELLVHDRVASSGATSSSGGGAGGKATSSSSSSSSTCGIPSGVQGGIMIWGSAFSSSLDGGYNGANGVAITQSGDVFVAGQLSGMTTFTNDAQVFTAPSGVVAGLACKDGTPSWIDAFNAGGATEKGGVGYGLAAHPTENTVLLGAAPADTGSFDLPPSVGALAAEIYGADGGKEWSEGRSYGALYVAYGPNGVRATLSGDCYLTVSPTMTYQVVTGPNIHCAALAYANGSYFVSGKFQSQVTYLGSDVVTNDGGAAEQMFVAAVDAGSGNVAWHVEYGTAAYNEALALAATPQMLVVAGRYGGTIDLPGGKKLEYANTQAAIDAFVFAMNLQDPTHPVIGAWGGGGQYEHNATAVAVMPNDDIIVAGNFQSFMLLPGKPDAGDTSVSGSNAYSAFLARLQLSNGTTGLSGSWTTRFFDKGSLNDVHVNAVAVGADGAIALAGYFSGNLGVNPGVLNLTANSGTAGFVARVAP